jgi:non-specific serine/threonine protein kinase/serine/threonine-protein kinase
MPPAMGTEGGPTPSAVQGQCTAEQTDVTQAAASTLDGADETLSPAALSRIAAAVAEEDETPQQIGRYRLAEVIGRGGMGEVWRAEQEQPLRRTVALKLIKLGMDTREVIARFGAERQALALMNHPNVAKVLDAGTSDAGRPYFVMEYVPGEPITLFCDRRQYTTTQRLQVFTQACAAVQHAHQKGVLHRDLKPGNILVTEESGQPQVKVIDFGVAKALQSRPGEDSLHTLAGQLVGTPEYMSPEQAGSDGADVDTRSDIYSLGVVLYELLSGLLPFDTKGLRDSGLAGIQRIIRDVDPPRPSTRLSSVGAAESTAIAQRRQTAILELRRQLRSELEWIPLKAMRKEREQRYATVAEFSVDIENYLTSQPLLAGPESKVYRLRKFVRRRRLEVIAAILLAASLMAGIIGTTTFAVRASRHRALAEQRANETARVANFQGRMFTDINMRFMGNRLRNDVVGEAAQSWKRAGLPAQEMATRQAQLESLLQEANFTNPAVQTLDRTIFERSLAAAHKEFADQPLVLASVLQQVATARSNLRQLDQAIAPQTEALAIRRHELGNEDPDTLQSINGLGWLLGRQGRWDEAEPLAREALTTRRRVIGGGDDRLTLRYLRLLAETVQEQGRLGEAEQYHRESVDGSARILPIDDPERLDAILRLGQVLLWKRKLDEAEPLIQEALDRMSGALGPNHRLTLVALSIHGTLRSVQGRLTEAESDYQKCFRLGRVTEGDDHRDSLFALMQLGMVLRKQRRLPEAETHLANALESFRREQGDDRTDTLLAEEQMAMLRQAQQHWEDAERRFADLYDRAARLRISPTNAARLMSGYGTCLTAMGRFADAEAPLLEAYGRLKRAELERHEKTREVVEALVEVCQHTNRPEEAARWRAELAQLRAATQPATTAE